jgi:hypothetical protein
MASSKAKNRARTTRTAARRPPPRRSRLSAYALPLAVLALSVIVAVAIVVLYKVSTSSSSSGPSGETVANIPCNTNEQLAVHYHAHLDILYHNQQVKLPANVGIQSTCLYWTHTHDDTGVIHIEAPKSSATRKFKLGEFFKVWGQPLSTKQVATINVASGEQVKCWVNGQPYSGDPANVTLASHEQIVIEIGPPFTDPPPTFAWDPSQYSQ